MRPTNEGLEAIEVLATEAEERAPTEPPPPRGRRRGFELIVDGEVCELSEIRGFREALIAATDPRAPMPDRLALLTPDEHTQAWLSRWSEDCAQVRRTLTLRRLFDARELVAIVTLATYGHGVDATLSVESVVLSGPRGEGWLRRSGVYGCVDVEAALAVPAAEPAPPPPRRGGGALVRLARWRTRSSEG